MIITRPLLRQLCVGAVVAAATAFAGCASTPPEEDPTQIKLNDIDTRVGRIERVVSNQSLLDIANQQESLRTELRTLRNDVDLLNHSLDAARKQQHDLYADLDQRLKAVEGRGAAAPAAASAVAGDSADKASYQAAFDTLKDGQYDRAVGAFQAFLATYPSSELADNAQYWLGEAYYVNKSFPEAMAAFQRVVTKYPNSRKVPDALLKVGYCHYEAKEYSLARDAWSQVIGKYPDTPAARLAQQRLDKLSAEQH